MEELARLLAVLPPAPLGWVEAAQELPRRTPNSRAWSPAPSRMPSSAPGSVADLEAALAESGISPTPRILAEARRRLGT